MLVPMLRVGMHTRVDIMPRPPMEEAFFRHPRPARRLRSHAGAWERGVSLAAPCMTPRTRSVGTRRKNVDLHTRAENNLTQRKIEIKSSGFINNDIIIIGLLRSING